MSHSTSATLSSDVSYLFTESVLSFVQPLNDLANKLALWRPPPGFTEFCEVDQLCSAVSSDGLIYPAESLSRAGPANEYPADGFSISPGPFGECCDVDCDVPTTSVENIVGSSSSFETSINPSFTNVLACADLSAHDDRVLDFSKDDSSFLGIVDANVHAGTTINVVKDAESLVDESSFLGLVDTDVLAGTTTNVSKDAECLVDESLSLGPVTAEMHTETTSHDEGRVAESPASGYLTGFAVVSADVHIRNTLKTNAIAASSVDECLISGSPVYDVKLTGFAVSDVLSPCCSVFGSLNSDISFFYPWHTKSAVITGFGPGPPVPGPLLGLRNPVYALKSAIIAGLCPGPPVSRSPDFLNAVYAFGSAVVASLGPGPPVPGCLDFPNLVYALGSATIAGLGPGPPAHEFLPFLDPIHSPKYNGSPTTLTDLNPVICSYAVKRFVFDTSVTLFLSVVLVSLSDNLCVLFSNEFYSCAQEFLFMNYVTSTYNILLRVVKILSLLLFVYH